MGTKVFTINPNNGFANNNVFGGNSSLGNNNNAHPIPNFLPALTHHQTKTLGGGSATQPGCEAHLNLRAIRRKHINTEAAILNLKGMH